MRKAEDPRIMWINGRLGMTFVRPSGEKNERWNSYFVWLSPDGEVRSEPVRLGRPETNSKNSYIVPLKGGKFALIDRANVPGERPAIQLYTFSSLEELLHPPAEYWKNHPIPQATILEAPRVFDHIGFNTVINTGDYAEGQTGIFVLVHLAKVYDSKVKLYVTALVELRPDTLQPLGDPVIIQSAVPHLLGRKVSEITQEELSLNQDKRTKWQ
ncbi:MAG: hypothetical protein D6706_18115 [Chloroflexi bacterium]|nr:MAG: hypothetical protein D6706_18115 [Chloroflexota bacterium]